VELIKASRLAVDELIDVLGRASIEAVLQLSAAGLAGEKHQGRKGGDLRWHGAQSGQVSLSDRKLRVKKPPAAPPGPGAGAGGGDSGLCGHENRPGVPAVVNPDA
jgi:hypothetical protein